LSRTTERKKHDDVAAKVASLLAAKTDFARATTDKNRNFYGNKVDSLDKQIDTLVYSLYSISETEIEALERASESNDLPLPAVEE
jgi:type II restriction/modification system DNA methylase subunit YeeA